MKVIPQLKVMWNDFLTIGDVKEKWEIAFENHSASEKDNPP